ncbi:MAG: hypothetical protein LBS36_08260 [Oscillospiraceae bacterium]|nr:hypothetical protein [Oscillospiraceae bacterium]
MSDTVGLKAAERSAADANNGLNCETYSLDYVLEQIKQIALQQNHLNNAIETLGEMRDKESADHGSPVNTSGQAKAQALADVVRCRETTNQQLLRFYEKMYDDLKPKAVLSIKEKALDVVGRTLSTCSELPEEKALLVNVFEAIRHLENSD